MQSQPVKALLPQAFASLAELMGRVYADVPVGSGVGKRLYIFRPILAITKSGAWR